MKIIRACAHGALNFFLPPRERDQWVAMQFQGNQTLKHLIESLGIPHPEIGIVKVDDHLASLDQIAQEITFVEVFPLANDDVRLHPTEICFTLDSHLGKLASYLRILGFDTSYSPDARDDALAQASADENRILLTRDRGLLMRRIVQYGYCIRNQDPHKQLLEVIQRFTLMDKANPFNRCPRCNGYLEPADKEKIADQLQRNTQTYFDSFWQCNDCHQIYWQGSHFDRIQSWLSELTANL
jgi:uncharacterized protein with PIN domain/sulfur carrier protein ThiS